MFETGIMLLFCLLMGLLFLAIVVWLAVTGRIFDLDGLTLGLICLTLCTFFMFNIFFSYRKGELAAVLNHYLKKLAASPPTAEASAPQSEEEKELVPPHRE